MIFNICSRLKGILLGILAIFKKALCCFSRRRKRSNSECEVLNMVSVIQNESNTTGSKNRNEDIRDWNSWDDSPRTVSEHIEEYRQKMAQIQKSDEPRIDYFQDMAPKIIKQKKLLIKTEQNSAATNFARLQASSSASIPIVQTADLEDWADEDDGNTPAGWDELNDENTKNLIRESRREMRAQRQQQLQKQKLLQQQQQQHSGFAERVSSIRQS